MLTFLLSRNSLLETDMPLGSSALTENKQSHLWTWLARNSWHSNFKCVKVKTVQSATKERQIQIHCDFHTALSKYNTNRKFQCSSNMFIARLKFFIGEMPFLSSSQWSQYTVYIKKFWFSSAWFHCIKLIRLSLTELRTVLGSVYNYQNFDSNITAAITFRTLT